MYAVRKAKIRLYAVRRFKIKKHEVHKVDGVFILVIERVPST